MLFGHYGCGYFFFNKLEFPSRQDSVSNDSIRACNDIVPVSMLKYQNLLHVLKYPLLQGTLCVVWLVLEKKRECKKFMHDICMIQDKNQWQQHLSDSGHFIKSKFKLKRNNSRKHNCNKSRAKRFIIKFVDMHIYIYYKQCSGRPGFKSLLKTLVQLFLDKEQIPALTDILEHRNKKPN